MLCKMMARNHQDVRVLSLLAFNAFEQGDYKKAIGAWEMMLRVLPENDSRREADSNTHLTLPTKSRAWWLSVR